ncbi:MAG TPA: D-aminoacylase [Candidatus Limnocylindrales bacterium]|nr:D-aminoacylase [Candidatus Limnocylindrales bacterium]
MIDLLIRGATLLDGTGAPPRRADVAVDAGHVVGVGDWTARGFAGAGVRRVVEAAGLDVAPGLIDMHSHADFTLPAYPDAINSLSQGVTTEVVGNCGYSPAPLASDPALAEKQRAACRALGPDLDWSWRSFGEYLERLDAARPAVNCVTLVGHGAARLATIGSDDRAASEAELAAMAGLVADALRAGAWGMSTGLVYPPGSFASTEEIVAVGEPLRATGALYASHIRNEADRLVDAVDEAIAIGRRLGVPVEVSHLKSAGVANHGRVGEAVERIEAARSAGLRVTADAYPYTAGSTLLTQLLPPWVQEGGVGEMVERLRSAEVRSRIAAEVQSGLPGWTNYVHAAGGWDGIRIAATVEPSLKHLEGRTMADLATRSGRPPLSLVLDTLVADRCATTMIVALMAEEDVETVFGSPWTAVGSDQLGVTSPEATVHPRCYGTFARVLGPFVRERGMLELGEAVRRATGLPASILGLTDRGRIAAGMVADLVLFDPTTISDEATYDAPTRQASGIETVLIGGRFAVDGGRVVDPGLGRVLRRRNSVNAAGRGDRDDR